VVEEFMSYGDKGRNDRVGANYMLYQIKSRVSRFIEV
jgi:hypothetical protein